jgi:hypothetical protein
MFMVSVKGCSLESMRVRDVPKVVPTNGSLNLTQARIKLPAGNVLHCTSDRA